VRRDGGTRCDRALRAERVSDPIADADSARDLIAAALADACIDAVTADTRACDTGARHA
jgi:hypothetical protein